jgi:hypothetical protein
MSGFVGSLSGGCRVFLRNPTSICSVGSTAYVENVGFVGFYREERGPVNLAPLSRISRKPAAGVQKWTPVGLQKGRPDGADGRKSLWVLVGLPGFEPGTSCTPNSGYLFIGYTDSRVLCSLHRLGASASARFRWPGNDLKTQFCAQFHGPWEHLPGTCLFSRSRHPGASAVLVGSDLWCVKNSVIN